MLNEQSLVTELPVLPNEVTLEQAAGLIPILGGKNGNNSFLARLTIHDPVIRVFSLAQLRKRGIGFSNKTLNMAMHVARRSSYLRKILIPFMMENHRLDLVDRLIKMEAQSKRANSDIPQQLFIALRSTDYALQVELHEKMFLQTGDLENFLAAYQTARERLPWRQAWKHVLRMLLLNSSNFEANLINALSMFEREGAREEYQTLARLINKLQRNDIAKILSAAQINYWSKKYDRSLELMQGTEELAKSAGVRSSLLQLAAKCNEAKGEYRRASEFYTKQNQAIKSSKFSVEKLREQIVARANLPIQGLEPDEHTNYYMMLGFPRSGTTLLENVLNSHTAIETIEESSALLGTYRAVSNSIAGKGSERENLIEQAYLHRKLYYQELDRHCRKGGETKAIIDKTPIMSSNIKYLEKIFANKRYIFSIRHPYDVVLSNWKQAYAQNNAMAAFNEMHSSCVFYNQVMTDWFDVFPDSDDRVCYIRYEELVLDFKNTVERALIFLNVDWEDEVLDFVNHSKKRAVRTPSYANVRKGMTLGVQSSWENFEFLFDDKCRELLDPWVKRFNYSK